MNGKVWAIHLGAIKDSPGENYAVPYAHRHDGKLLIDTREKNRTTPPTLWFIAETVQAGR